MSVATALLVTATVILWISGGWVLHQSRRAERRRSPALLARLLGVLALTLTVSLAGPVLGPAVEPLLGPRAGTLVKNWLTVLVFATALAFLSYTAGRESRAVSAFLVRVPAATALAVMTVGWYASPPAARGGEFTDSGLAGGMTLYWVVGLLYIGFGAGGAAWLLVRAAGISQKTTTATGLRVAATGFALVAVFLAGARLVVMGLLAAGTVPPEGATDTAQVLQRSGILLIGVGLALPPVVTRVAAGRIWGRHVRLHRAMRPLWDHLAEVFPERILDDRSSRWRPGPWRPRAVHRRFYRRVTECRDGLVMIAPSLPPDVADAGPAEQARAVRRALRDHDRRLPPTGPGPVVAAPDGPTVDEDARRLAALAAHLPRRPDREPDREDDADRVHAIDGDRGRPGATRR